MTPMSASCPKGTYYATIRRNVVKAGKWAEFERAVAAHTAWYAAKGSETSTRIIRVIETRPGKSGFSSTDVMTITRYIGVQPPRDAGYAAFTARYKASASVKDEARICMPSA